MKIRIIKNKKQLNEEFYFEQGFDQEQRPPANPLSLKLVKLIISKLPGAKKFSMRTHKMRPLQASGAEGIVVGIDDKRVIKLFHDVSNAAKNLHLVSQDIPETAQVYSMGKIILNDPVVYYKFGSSHNARTLANPTKELYFIVMQRVVPDSYIYRYVDEVWKKLNMVFQTTSDAFVKMFSTGDPFIKRRINKIYEKIMADPEFYNVPEKLQNNYKQGKVDTFDILIKSKKDLARFNTALGVYKKKERKARKQKGLKGAEAQLYLLYDVKGYPVSLKNLILNKIGAKEDIPFIDSIWSTLMQSPEMKKTAKKQHPLNKNKGATLADDLQEITNLIKAIRVDKGLAWNDIHQEQFGRNERGDLIGLDLGIKGTAKELAAAPGKFEAANIIRVATNFDQQGQPTMTLAESKKKSIKR